MCVYTHKSILYTHVRVCVYKARVLDFDKPSTLQFWGWKMGFEPTTPGTTIQCSNQLSYNHHINALLSA